MEVATPVLIVKLLFFLQVPGQPVGQYQGEMPSLERCIDTVRHMFEDFAPHVLKVPGTILQIGCGVTPAPSAEAGAKT